MFVSLFFIIFYINYLVWAAASMFICFDEHLLQINIAVFVHRTNLLVSICCYKNVLLFAGLLQPLNPVREFSPRSFTCPTRSIARVQKIHGKYYLVKFLKTKHWLIEVLSNNYLSLFTNILLFFCYSPPVKQRKNNKKAAEEKSKPTVRKSKYVFN